MSSSKIVILDSPLDDLRYDLCILIKLMRGGWVRLRKPKEEVEVKGGGGGEVMRERKESMKVN